MRSYYDSRLAEYDEVYLKPERQKDLQRLHAAVQERAEGRTVLELACGTGYWTAVASKLASHIFATDVSPSALEVARQRQYSCPVEFSPADAYQPHGVPAQELTMAMFWLSHVPQGRIREFFAAAAAATCPGGAMLFMDNRFVDGSSTPIARTDEEGNTYQQRRLRDGSSHEVLKNFLSASYLRDVLAPVSRRTDILETDYYWLAYAELHSDRGRT